MGDVQPTTRPTKRLTKDPPPNVSFTPPMNSIDFPGQLRRQTSLSQSQSPSSSGDYSVSNHQRTQSSHTSSSSSFEQSPRLATSKFSNQSPYESTASRYRFSARRSLKDQQSSESSEARDIVKGQLDSPGSQKDLAHHSSVRRPGPPRPLHTTPNAQMSSPALRQSASFSSAHPTTKLTLTRSESGPHHSKRFSDEAKNLAPWRKKSAFSSIFNNVLGSPKGMKISAPENPVHVTHVGLDKETGRFTVCGGFPNSCTACPFFYPSKLLQEFIRLILPIGFTSGLAKDA